MSHAMLSSPILAALNSGVIVIDDEYNIQYLNAFIERHGNLQLAGVLGKSLFSVFADLPEAWLKRKLMSVLDLKTPAFSSWEQRQYIFKLPHLRPITSSSQYMAQNCTMLPLETGQHEQPLICILIEDATDAFVYQQHLSRTLIELEKANRQDGLTKVQNRRYWEEQLKQEIHRAQRYQHSLSLILFDLDKFKDLNDKYGHLGGDFVLVELSSFISSLLRDSDLFGRYGGEEFGIILPDTGLEGAEEVAERICRAVADYPMLFNQQTIRTTLSIGVAEFVPKQHFLHDDLIRCADMALYNAKRSGRNRVCCYQAGETDYHKKAN
ncbi:diguanylate cyclase [Rheinheimera sp. F8]|uniref:sensor domain-containing diguanylate cyclase n=1 Tax=Rheinheimera sp. F8 TaxID=1763998 RepID=UPI000744A27F|nr:diguanylate cyclase [Rheinheimera sp. F8]ALZ77145.1 diguanylate cyclase [Rheinheimera sp. F8]